MGGAIVGGVNTGSVLKPLRTALHTISKSPLHFELEHLMPAGR